MWIMRINANHVYPNFHTNDPSSIIIGDPIYPKKNIIHTNADAKNTCYIRIDVESWIQYDQSRRNRQTWAADPVGTATVYTLVSAPFV